jgi:hypothetical protein
MKPTLLLLAILFHLCSYAQSDSKVQLGIQFVSSENLASPTFKGKDYSGIMEVTLDQFAAKLEALAPTKGHILLEQTFHKDKSPTYQVYACPALEDATIQSLIKGYESGATVLRSYLGDFAILYVAAIDGGCEEEDFILSPEFIHPKAEATAALEAADLAGKVELIKQWARQEVIPILATLELGVDIEFKGVRAMGHLLQNMDYEDGRTIISLTESNEDYWRALMEMEPRNHLISFSKIMLHIAKGEFDYVQPYIDLSNFFADPKSVPAYYLAELQWRLEIFKQDLNTQIQQGIALHDAKDYDEAIATYENLLKVYPNSAWLRYESYYSENAKQESVDFKLWQDKKAWIYAANPLYHLDVHASNGAEGYRQFRRLKTQGLFKDRSSFIPDLFSYADIALDLEVNAFAAHLYWYLHTTIDAKKMDGRGPLKYYLYALHKMGITEFDKLFKEVKAADMKQIDKEREAAMKESTIYQSFSK